MCSFSCKLRKISTQIKFSLYLPDLESILFPSFQSPYCKSSLQQKQTRQLDSPTLSSVMLLPRKVSLGSPLCSGWGQVARTPLLQVETSLWILHHPTPSPSTHCASPKMDSTPARPLSGLLLLHHQLHSKLKVICSYSSYTLHAPGRF